MELPIFAILASVQVSTAAYASLIENPIEKIQQLRGVEYQWNDLQNTYPSGSLDSGIIAQDVQKVLPQLVKETNKGYLGVRHDRLVGLLVESIKEQQEQINELNQEVKELKMKNRGN